MSGHCPNLCLDDASDNSHVQVMNGCHWFGEELCGWPVSYIVSYYEYLSTKLGNGRSVQPLALRHEPVTVVEKPKKEWKYWKYGSLGGSHTNEKPGQSAWSSVTTPILVL
jgi:hypothetical protein